MLTRENPLAQLYRVYCNAAFDATGTKSYGQNKVHVIDGNKRCHNSPTTVLGQVKIFGPRVASVQHDPSLLEAISPEFEQFSCIR